MYNWHKSLVNIICLHRNQDRQGGGQWGQLSSDLLMLASGLGRMMQNWKKNISFVKRYLLSQVFSLEAAPRLNHLEGWLTGSFFKKKQIQSIYKQPNKSALFQRFECKSWNICINMHRLFKHSTHQTEWANTTVFVEVWTRTLGTNTVPQAGDRRTKFHCGQR